MLEQLFGSKTRVVLLRMFINNPDKSFFVREMSRNMELHLNSVRRELANLEEIGIITSATKEGVETEESIKEPKDNKRYYILNPHFPFVEELRALMIKAQVIVEKSLVQKIEKIGNIAFFLLSGIFVGRRDAPVDMLIVGSVDKTKFSRLIKTFEKEMGQTLNYSIMPKADFLFRKNVTDKFLYDLLEGKNIIVIDNL